MKYTVSKEIDDEVKGFLAGCIGAVEAGGYEEYCLFFEVEKLGHEWKSQNSGIMRRVGDVGKHPVCISMNVHTVRGHRILFYHATSRVVDHKKIEKWLKKAMPETAIKDGRLNKTNAMNFYNIFPR